MAVPGIMCLLIESLLDVTHYNGRWFQTLAHHDSTQRVTPHYYRGRWDGERKTIVGDDDVSWLVPAFSEIWRVLRADSFAVSFYGWSAADVFVGTFKGLGFRLVSHLAFVKNVWGLGRLRGASTRRPTCLRRGDLRRRRGA